MAKIVWKQLKKEDLNKVISYLDRMPDDKKPLYGLWGVKRNNPTRCVRLARNVQFYPHNLRRASRYDRKMKDLPRLLRRAMTVYQLWI